MTSDSEHLPVPKTVGWHGIYQHLACAICNRMIDPETGKHVDSP